MKKIQPKLAKGTRDFLPEQVRKRKFLLDTIRDVFTRFGFQEIETPAIESLETLTGKYGEEGDKLLFKILNSGNFLSKANPEDLAEKDSRAVTGQISEKGLRYDLTVPLARYVVQHQNDLIFPFKRYHIGPVWRADRPQKGRYREFYQCDADVIGSKSMINEAELTQILSSAFEQLGIKVSIQLNHRKVLEGIIELAEAGDHYTEILVAIDKMDKIGEDGVRRELEKLNLTEDKIQTLFELFRTNDLSGLKERFKGRSAAGEEGIAELERVFSLLNENAGTFCPDLARGLDYYTGTIWEVKAMGVSMGTIAAGGRYDNLTEMFGGQHMSGVGISFGVERIYDVMETLEAFPAELSTSTVALIVNFGGESETAGWSLVEKLRQQGIPSELFPDNAKMKKQMSYADKINIPYVIFIGDEELASGKVKLKDMETGEQMVLSEAELLLKICDA
ncbi:MAG: histidine--tRNA ligase [Bacteroidetes bacterium]|nr:histidine--tRNA ligase [Bacteroidota bacterium]